MHEDTIRDIRKRCRLAMNGVASTSMRQKGMSYKINFGLLIPQIKEMAGLYQPDSELAKSLWKEDTRELKILGTLLFPTDKYTEVDAAEWIKEINNQEIREQVCFNLFQNLSFADKLALDWSKSDTEEMRITGYWLLVRLLMLRKTEVSTLDSFYYIITDSASTNIFLRNAALLALKHIGRQNQTIADQILKKLSVYKEDTNTLKQEAYNSIAFEFEFFHST